MMTQPYTEPSFTTRTLIFIDPSVENYQHFVNSASSQAEVVVLDVTKDGVTQITETLHNRTSLNLHIISHGSPGCLYLGKGKLNLDTLDDYSTQLKTWSLSADNHFQFTIHLYGCQVAAGDAGSEFIRRLHHLTGATIAASTQKTGSTALGGNWDFEVTTGIVTTQLPFDADAIAAYASVLAATLTVNSNDDSEARDDVLTLREAILVANGDLNFDNLSDAEQAQIIGNLGTGATDQDTIAFNLPDSDSLTITPSSNLPNIGDSVIIDGTTQPGFNGSPIVEIRGDGAGDANIGLFITASESIVRGLVVNSFSEHGIFLSGTEATGNRIEGNYIGTDITGTVAQPNDVSGVFIQNSSNNIIGGTTPEARNIISGNDEQGIFLIDPGTTGNRIIGNYIGTDVTGTEDLGNGQSGVFILNAPDNIIGGTDAGEGNVISGNDERGILILTSDDPGQATGNQVLDNFIGTAANGTDALSNGGGNESGDGVEIIDASDNTVANNIIAFNQRNGITVFFDETDATGNRISENSIFGNEALGIDIGEVEGVSENDPEDDDDIQNFPVLSSVTSDGNSTTIEGILNSTPNTEFVIEFFANSSDNAQGEIFLDSITVATDDNGEASFTAELSSAVDEGQFITTTAIDPNGNTSEFGTEPVEAVVNEDADNDTTDNSNDDSTPTRLRFTLSESQANFVNEVGVFAVDDDNGGIDTDGDGLVNINPGESGYVEAALERATVIFSALPQKGSNLPDFTINDFSRLITSFDADFRLEFYLVSDSTTDAVLAGQTSENQVLFSLASANLDEGDRLKIEEGDDNSLTLQWEDEVSGGDEDFDDLVLNFERVEANPSLGTSLQGGQQQELIDLRDVTGEVSVEIVVNSEAAFDNIGGFYAIQNEQGTVFDAEDNVINPGEDGYTDAAINATVVEFGKQGTFTEILDAGVILAPYIVADGEEVYFPFLEANSDSIDHVRLFGDNIFGFEDTPDGGDFDYNDLVVQVSFA